jgi:Flp pilus assembly pilin Flp
MKTMKLLKRSWLGPWLVGVLCVLVLVATTPREAAAATIIEYALLAALLSIAAIAMITLPEPNSGAHVVFGQLETAVNAAALANSEGDQPKEISRQSKALGAAEALMGMTTPCDACGELRDVLQQIIGLVALMKSQTLGVASTCNPNGVIQGNEQCDPLAVPTGCPVNPVQAVFCNDECQCQAITP